MDKLPEKEGGEDKILNHMLLQQLLNYLDKDEEAADLSEGIL